MILGIDATRANNIQKTGVEWYAFFLIENLKKTIPENVKVILYTNEPLRGNLAKLPKNWEEKVLKWPPKRFWTQIRLSFEMLFHAPDVLFVPAHVFPIIHPKKTVMTVHDIAAQKFPESYSPFERWYSLWSAKVAATKLWKTIVPTNFVKTELINFFGLKNNSIKVVYHGFDSVYKIEENNSGILQKYNIKKPYILTVGRIETKKNTGVLVEAFEKIKMDPKYNDLKLVLVGKDGYGSEKIHSKIEKSINKKDIFVLGWIEREDLPVLYSEAEVFVLPSLYEGFGLPVLESFASKTPVVISKIDALEEIAIGAALEADINSADEFAEKIKIFMNDKVLKDKKILEGEKVIEKFSWEKCARETWDILRQ